MSQRPLSSSRRRALGAWMALASVLAGAAVTPAAARGPWRGPGGEPLPFHTEDEVLAFLRQAEVVQKKEIPQGVNKPLKVRLRRAGVEANAVFRTVNLKKARHETGGEIILDFHDSYVYECAAYQVNRLLGLDHVPPCVLRSLGRRKGTMQLWIEDAMTEEERRRKNIQPPVAIDWVRQQQTMRIFDGLIYNFDRNQGNMLIDRDWKLWFIDHTRSFHKSTRVEDLERITWVERGLWEKLRSLARSQLEERLGGMIESERIDAVLERRDVLVRHLEKRIAELGEGVVVYDASQPPPEGVEERPDYAVAGSTDDIPAAPEGGGGGER